MDFMTFILTVLMISLSGVLAPGPMLALTLSEGKRNAIAGLEISAGHAMVEVPIILVLYYAGSSFDLGILKEILALSGGILMFYLAFRELREKTIDFKIRGVISGIAVSILNPYFVIWWLTVGFTLVLIAVSFGPFGLIAFIVAHEACDFVWYGSVSAFARKISSAEKMSRALSIISASILFVFGAYFVFSSLRALALYFI